MSRTPDRRLGALVAVSLAALSVTAPVASGTVRLPAVFGDGMVLQCDKPARVWGWAAAGETVSVSFAGQVRTATAAPQGRWVATLEPMPFSVAGADLMVQGSAGGASVVVRDVLVGELWLCSGQSNMQLSLQAANGEGPAQTADYPQIRLFVTGFHAPAEPAEDCEGRWVVCSPQTVGAFSAVGYYFGRALHQELKRPVGLILSAHGATSAEAWISREGLRSEPLLQPILARFEAQPKDPKGWDPHLPTGLFNGEIAPFTSLSLRGVIWYQGETDASRAFLYRSLFPALIRDWRRAWGEVLPFYFVQLANHLAAPTQPVSEPWAELREAQALALGLPDTGMAVAIDLGSSGNIHPPNKWDVGARLARWALAGTYGRDLVPSGPRYRTAEREDGRIRVRFAYGDGLTAKGGPLRQFAVAGEDRRFVWAEAAVDGETVVVSSPDVTKPVAVRYAWSNNPEGCNLYNREGLPAAPFRTDDWPGVTDQAHLSVQVSAAVPARRSVPVPTGEPTGNTLDVRVGVAVERPWDEVKTDGYAYAPRQVVLPTGETRIWLPYGSARGVYREVEGFQITDPKPGATPALTSSDASACGRFVLKVHFDRPVEAFRLQGGYAEFKPRNAVAGVEYSVDGERWTLLQETDQGGIHNLLVKPDVARAAGLRTQDLWLRFYTRSAIERSAAKAEGAWLKVWMGGDPSWGDASRTFFDRQWQLWVLPAE